MTGNRITDRDDWLDTLLIAPPPLPGSDDFSARVMAEIGRQGRLRRLVLGTASVIGGALLLGLVPWADISGLLHQSQKLATLVPSDQDLMGLASGLSTNLAAAAAAAALVLGWLLREE